MGTRSLSIATGVVIALLAGAALAQSASPETRARLEHKAESLDAQLRGKLGASERQRLQAMRSAIGAALRRVDAGQPLAPRELEQLTNEIVLARGGAA